ncbi:MAG: hypothetical protein COW01_00275 [Bdellovibrionales bacterium CG12_big_fil_rev_8_21_14_0_65_38_15]|nr:MAG: hypothetical protein COW79_14165 [Bdellovibrionales bacterium CG22_combo_CG10-13_8_21_14_all_38_13]PIQ57404.1 MAG: hypothetical protein COW01_00275 [Bdellovibrionales bacterium CG12_big_fil_rev_8_21_14_0_65_38_15]PIR31124.1 MAG: hypothetical protein COV38_01755 [Bdellovibrionales bacterium CG11_big_fil_rev_8_21_14_0_20_38_13]
MKFIAHRINQSHHLEKVDHKLGVEVDVRVWQDELILAHDPFQFGEKLETFLKNYHHSTLIFNIKCEQIEPKVIELAKKYSINDYFFLDSSIPMINKLTKANIDQFAIRLSELEPIEQLHSFSGKAQWVWVDCFTRFILTREMEQEIHKMGFKVCLVCPSLQGRSHEIEQYISMIKSQKIKVDAVCSKIEFYDQWMKD